MFISFKNRRFQFCAGTSLSTNMIRSHNKPFVFEVLVVTIWSRNIFFLKPKCGALGPYIGVRGYIYFTATCGPSTKVLLEVTQQIRYNGKNKQSLSSHNKNLTNKSKKEIKKYRQCYKINTLSSLKGECRYYERNAYLVSNRIAKISLNALSRIFGAI